MKDHPRLEKRLDSYGQSTTKKAGWRVDNPVVHITERSSGVVVSG